MLEAGADADVAGFVDHRLDAQRPAVLEVLLDAAVLGAKLEPDLAAGGEDAAAEGRKRGRDHCHPAVEEGLNVGRAEAVADRLQPRWVVTAGKAVTQRAERGAGPLGLPFRPLMPVQPHLRRIREVGTDLDEAGPELRVVEVEGVDADPPLLALEGEAGDARL